MTKEKKKKKVHSSCSSFFTITSKVRITGCKMLTMLKFNGILLEKSL